MAKAFTDYVSRTDFLTADVGDLVAGASDVNLKECITEAAKNIYSKRRPYLVTEILTGDGNTYLDLPTDFDVAFSKIRHIEYPLGENPSARLRNDEYELQRVPAAVSSKGVRILWTGTNYPGLDDTAYICYTRQHACTAASITVPDADYEGVCQLASHVYALALAAYFSQAKDRTISADSVDFKTKASECRMQAGSFFNEFDKLIPVNTAGAIAIGNWDVRMQQGTDRLIHKADQRRRS